MSTSSNQAGRANVHRAFRFEFSFSHIVHQRFACGGRGSPAALGVLAML